LRGVLFKHYALARQKLFRLVGGLLAEALHRLARVNRLGRVDAYEPDGFRFASMLTETVSPSTTLMTAYVPLAAGGIVDA
jgi:hypothetical protein